MSRMRMIARGLGAWVAVLPLMLSATGAFADPPGRVGRLAEQQGAVWLQDAQSREWTQVPLNQPLTEGDRVRTDRGGRAQIQVGSTQLRLDGDTEIEFRRLDDAKVRLSVDKGTVAVATRDAAIGSEFEFLVPEGRLTPTGVAHIRVDVAPQSSFLTAWSGRARFEAIDSVLDVEVGRRAEVWRDGRSTYFRWLEMERDRFNDWAQADQRAEDRREAWQHVSPEMTGAEDLDRHGRWSSHPEYGMVWSPLSVAVDWAPYRYGRWAWVRPWGWTWVDDAPWGFAPFHYGNWVHWGGRWCWAPGPRVARPVFAPALVAWVGPGGGGVSVGISLGARSPLPPSVGWVPLAPREAYVPWFNASPRWRERHDHWPRQTPGVVPTGPVMYTNRGVPGGVTVVSSDILRERRPVNSSVVQRVDPASFQTVTPQVSQWRPNMGAEGRAVQQEPGGAVPVERGRPVGRESWQSVPRQEGPQRQEAAPRPEGVERADRTDRFERLRQREREPNSTATPDRGIESGRDRGSERAIERGVERGPERNFDRGFERSVERRERSPEPAPSQVEPRRAMPEPRAQQSREAVPALPPAPQPRAQEQRGGREKPATEPRNRDDDRERRRDKREVQ